MYDTILCIIGTIARFTDGNNAYQNPKTKNLLFLIVKERRLILNFSPTKSEKQKNANFGTFKTTSMIIASHLCHRSLAMLITTCFNSHSWAPHTKARRTKNEPTIENRTKTKSADPRLDLIASRAIHNCPSRKKATPAFFPGLVLRTFFLRTSCTCLYRTRHAVSHGVYVPYTLARVTNF